jgi:TRAP-type C4-dicarboxylate transport system permease small subunit
MVIPYMFIPVGFGLMGLYYLALLFAPDMGKEARGPSS